MEKILSYLAGASVILGTAIIGKEFSDACIVAAGAEPSSAIELIQYLPNWAKASGAAFLAGMSGVIGYEFDRILNERKK